MSTSRPPDDQTDWPPLVRAIRSRLGLSQGGLAEMLCCNRGTVIRWESGERTPTGLYKRELRRLTDQFPADGERRR